ncbi:hypothetical protein L9F63_021507 [Diploptera punctata]|uniref:Enoyl-CoA hydratase n=1 Tax=Diploptera punctata TaxID=6984 RepID=A0AAD8EBX6_DIPPU|nr:hypothetical protein L9F63_021507 [Diploptera punctata]
MFKLLKCLSEGSFHNVRAFNKTSCQHKVFRSNLCSTTNDEILVEKLGPITTIGINRPNKRNCVNRKTAKQLSEAISQFENDDSALVAVLHGIGGNFCAGYDLEELSTFDKDVNFDSKPGDGPMGPTRRMVKKPLIAAVSGYAVAGGMELALMCDLRVMEETAVMGVFCRRFGVPLIDGGTVRLQALVGHSRALDLILTGRAIKAQEAFEWGLANRLVACGTSLGQAVNLANSLVKFPQECLRADRLSTYNAAFNAASYEEGFEFELNNGAPVLLKESVTGAKKFVAGIGKHGKFTNISGGNLDEFSKSKL